MEFVCTNDDDHASYGLFLTCSTATRVVLFSVQWSTNQSKKSDNQLMWYGFCVLWYNTIDSNQIKSKWMTVTMMPSTRVTKMRYTLIICRRLMQAGALVWNTSSLGAKYLSNSNRIQNKTKSICSRLTNLFSHPFARWTIIYIIMIMYGISLLLLLL